MKKPERKDLDWSDRLAFAVAGALVMLYGYGQILRGKLIYTNWRGLDVPALFAMFLGAVFLLVSIFPWSRIHFLWDAGRKKRRY
jgi:hypothetical protein